MGIIRTANAGLLRALPHGMMLDLGSWQDTAMKLTPYHVRWIRALAANGKTYSHIRRIIEEQGEITVSMGTVASIVRRETWLEDKEGFLQGERPLPQRAAQ